MTEGILARPIDLERVMRVLDERHAKPPRDDERNHLLDESGLATAGITRETEDFHGALCDEL